MARKCEGGGGLSPNWNESVFQEATNLTNEDAVVINGECHNREIGRSINTEWTNYWSIFVENVVIQAVTSNPIEWVNVYNVPDNQINLF